MKDKLNFILAYITFYRTRAIAAVIYIVSYKIVIVILRIEVKTDFWWD